MFDVVLADDEPWTLSGIEKSFPWTEYGFNVVFSSTDPSAVLKFCLSEKIDVVFLDIRMPGLSGLDIMRKLTAVKTPPIFVVISGFDNFEYVQKALHYGAFDYCLKPIDKNTTSEILIRIKKRLMERKRIEGVKFFDTLFDRDLDISKELRANGLPGNYSFWSVLIFKGDKDGSYTVPDFSGDVDFIIVKTAKHKNAFILNSKTNEFHVDIQTIAGSWGISSISDTPVRLSSLFQQADIAAESDFIDKNGLINRYSSVEVEKIRKYSNYIIDHYNKGRDNALKTEIEMIPLFFKENAYTVEALSFFWNDVINGISCEKEKITIFYHYTEIIRKFENIIEFSSHLLTVLTEFRSLIPESISGTQNNNFKKMLMYIENNFTENLQLRELAGQFGINYSYSSELCKKTLGLTFSNYLNKLRITEACTLLNKTEKSLQDVAETVGYEDYFYFSRVFKKQMDIPPLKYRKKIIENMSAR